MTARRKSKGSEQTITDHTVASARWHYHITLDEFHPEEDPATDGGMICRQAQDDITVKVVTTCDHRR